MFQKSFKYQNWLTSSSAGLPTIEIRQDDEHEEFRRQMENTRIASSSRFKHCF